MPHMKKDGRIIAVEQHMMELFAKQGYKKCESPEQVEARRERVQREQAKQGKHLLSKGKGKNAMSCRCDDAQLPVFKKQGWKVIQEVEYVEEEQEPEYEGEDDIIAPADTMDDDEFASLE